MKTTLRSAELTCPSCIAKIEKALTKLDGVTEAKVIFASGRITVEHDPEIIKSEELQKAIQAVGYEAHVYPF